MKVKDSVKDEIAALMVEYKSAGGVGLEKTIDRILNLVEEEEATVFLESNQHVISSRGTSVPVLDFDQAVQQVIDNMNFYKVHSVMVYLGWTWGLSGKTPNPKEIEQSARDTLYMVKDGGCGGTGGFEAEYDKLDQVLSLKFVLEGWDHYEEE